MELSLLCDCEIGLVIFTPKEPPSSLTAVQLQYPNIYHQNILFVQDVHSFSNAMFQSRSGDEKKVTRSLNFVITHTSESDEPILL